MGLLVGGRDGGAEGGLGRVAEMLCAKTDSRRRMKLLKGF